MEKLKMHSLNKVNANIQKIASLFPNCLTERKNPDGEVEYAIDFDVLRQELSSVIVEGKEERYQFTWPDKKKSILAANAPISDTLRPCREESVDFDSTQNLYIEGDNLAVLKLLQETYLGKIKMIYIDPPYNTGNDFVYNDDFAESAEEYLAHSGQYDEEGNRLVTNPESNGRFHTDWLNMLFPRLKLAKDLLTDDGVIFISIDDNETDNLRKLCDEVFGPHNYVGTAIWERAFSPKNDAKYFSSSHDYVVVYSKNLLNFEIGKLPRTAEMNARYKNPDNDPKGPWQSGDLTAKTYSPAYDYPITTPSGKIVSPTSGRSWITSKENMQKWIAEGRIWFGEQGDNTPRYKRYLSEMTDGIVPTTLWKFDEVGHSQEGRQEVKNLFDGKGYFDGPKPVRLLNRIMKIANTDQNAIILDFFSGSATTAHAVMQLNAEDGGNRKFIMVQLPEETDPKSEAYKAGYKTICEIGKERIRRAGQKIKETKYEIAITHEITPDEPETENAYLKKTLHEKYKGETKLNMKALQTQTLDTGFRVLKLDSSNMKDVYYNPDEYVPSMFESLADNIKADRTPEDLLFQVMLDLGVLLSSKIEETTVCGKKVFNVADGFLYACFDSDVSEETITEIAKKKPYYFVMRDSSMANDSVATNFEQILATYCPDTEWRVL